MEYYNIVANYTGHLTFMWSGKFNNSLESQGKSEKLYYEIVGTLNKLIYNVC